ncbi:hypothetical protein [Fimbriiglobus ruber]|uniref:hypothetical protein n=1 Tax=Fimbriiglobus ruber TaxID=1908690 RepID=UPI001EE6A4B7|nr:hypothetical protein [Fimbriiglobus ruber]
MTETEWLTNADSNQFEDFLRGTVSYRKLRLFAVACFRPFSHLCTDVRSQNALRTSEEYADGMVELYALISAHLYATDVLDNVPAPASDTYHYAVDAAYFAVQLARPSLLFRDGEVDIDPIDVFRLTDGISYLSGHAKNNFGIDATFDKAVLQKGIAIEKERQCRLLRDIFCNPFRPVAIEPEWSTSTVVSLAEGIYAEKAFDRLPILADALQDAGCDNENILSHCRGEGPHVRGC